MGSKTIAEIAEEVEEIATLELMKKCFGKDEHIFEDEGNYTIKDKGIYIAGCFYSQQAERFGHHQLQEGNLRTKRTKRHIIMRLTLI